MAALVSYYFDRGRHAPNSKVLYDRSEDSEVDNRLEKNTFSIADLVKDAKSVVGFFRPSQQFWVRQNEMAT